MPSDLQFSEFNDISMWCQGAADSGPVVEVAIDGRLNLDTLTRRPGRTELWVISQVIVTSTGHIAYYGARLVLNDSHNHDDQIVLHDGRCVSARIDRRHLDRTGRRPGVQPVPLPYGSKTHIGHRHGTWGWSG